MVDYLVERTGFSADQGSIFDDTSLNTSGSFNVQEPATKYMKVAMCVVPQSSADAGVKPLRDTVEMDDSVSNVSVASSSKSHLMLLQSKMVVSRAKAKAAALAAEAANDEHILLQAIQEHSNRSNASSRRSGRRPLATAGTDVDQLVDDVFDLSRELSFIVQGGSMDNHQACTMVKLSTNLKREQTQTLCPQQQVLCPCQSSRRVSLPCPCHR